MIIFILLSMICLPFVFAQDVPSTHPRVAELEEKLADEASRYFSRRYPGEPFFVKAEVTPLRRSSHSVQKEERLPYYDQDTEEIIDEWDDPNVPLASLRNRVVKISLELSVPYSFNDQKIEEIRQELPVFLKLLTYRDSIKVERRFKGIPQETPPYVYYIIGGFLVASLMSGLMLRWNLSKSKAKEDEVAPQRVFPQAMSAPLSAPVPSPQKEGIHKTAAAVSGDVTFHDPIKTLDIVHIKLKQIEASQTFPTLKDVMLLDTLAKMSPAKFGAIIYELPLEWQRNLYKMGLDHNWLEAFCHPGRIDHDCLNVLDKLSRQRHLVTGDRAWENLLIQIWRLGEKSTTFFKSIDTEHAFSLLSVLPKALALGIAKKTFPGSWGRLLERRTEISSITPKQLENYMGMALELVPWFEWKLLEDYKRDNEILGYLSKVGIDDEKDLYETLSTDSFLFKVRPPFYKIFSLSTEEFQVLLSRYPLEKWAMVVLNSSRVYVKFVMDHLDEKKKIIFSSHLKNLDQRSDLAEEQALARQEIAKLAQNLFPESYKISVVIPKDVNLEEQMA